MITSVTAVAAAALLAVLGSISALLIRASRWPEPTPPSKHGLTAHPDGVRPISWDDVTAGHRTTPLREAYVNDSQEIPAPEEVAPISAPPADDEPIDELDPRWDWRAYADAEEADRELVAA
jgi:hypothetical protein